MSRKVLSTLLILAGWSGAALAQGYPYGGPPRPARGVGYNCEAAQAGVTGISPFSCPLPGARPLGARCFCGQPPSFFGGAQPPVGGQVVP